MSLTVPAVQGYSFYLNVVVVSTNVDNEDPAPQPAPAPPPESAPPKPTVVDLPPTPDKEELERTASSDDTTNNNNVGEVLMNANKHVELLKTGKNWVDSFSQSLAKRMLQETTGGIRRTSGQEATKKLARDGRKILDSIGSSITKGTSNLNKNVKTFVSQKTMVSRARKAVQEMIPRFRQEWKMDFEVRYRFQQGPVFVLEVDFKGSSLEHMVLQTLGPEATMQFTTIERACRGTLGEESNNNNNEEEEGQNGHHHTENGEATKEDDDKKKMNLLILEKTHEALIQEVVPEIRKGLMTKLALWVPQTMKDYHKDLEIECIALEDDEEAKWLYNFLEFMESMKQ